MHHDDPLTAAHTTAYLSLKYFDNSYNYYGATNSIRITASTAADVWTALEAAGTVPAGATKVQAAIQLWQCEGDTSGACFDGNGAVYFDDLSLEVQADSGGGDTGAPPTDTGTPPTDTGAVDASLLANDGFEGGWNGDWLIYPASLANYAIVHTGDPLYNSPDLFTALAGTQSLKVYGQWTGTQNETPIYQEFAATAGDTLTFNGYAWMHHDDPLVATHTYAYLSLKYFDNSYNYYGSDDSVHFDANSPVDTWTWLEVVGTVPAGATKVQPAIEYWQCFGDTSGACWDGVGAVYFDELTLQ